ncbi:unnamed protein product [Danaus chrysippus]|uniref:Odorant receptor n=1 Tax=Danaus chrysippus TaxID=151541 RepID=A0A8J2VPP2_9NEOP|nr:unnamed protein product [Danaus chrysippus]
MMNDLIMQAHLMHLLCQYTILADCFETIIDDCIDSENKIERSKLVMTEKFRERYLKRLNDLVEQHKLILNNTMELKKSLSVPMLGQLAASTMLICCVSFQATRSENISKAIYCSGWECGLMATKGVRARLMFAVMRARKPLVLSAGGLFDLSLVSYTTEKNKKVFKYLASAMNSSNLDISTTERKDIFYSWGKRNKQSLKLLIFLGTCTLVFWFFYPLFDDAEYNLIIVISLPFDYRTPALYPVTYITTFIVFMYIAYFVMLHDLVIQVYLVHLICQLAILNDCFENILQDCKKGFSKEQLDSIYLNEEFVQKYVKRLGKLVDQHTFIINNTLKLRDILSTPMLLQVAVSTTLICSIGFQIATVNMNFLAIHIV